MSHNQTRDEFTRQAATMASAAVFNAQDVIAAIVDAAAPRDQKQILDVGCGPGILVEALARRGGKITGIDLTPEMLNQARRRCAQANLSNVEFLCGAAEKLPFPDAHFDAIVARTILHHLKNPSAAMMEMARVLKPTGRLALADIVSSENPTESQLHNALEIIRDPSHSRMLPLSELLEITYQAGLKIISQKSWQQDREFGEWMKIVNAPLRDTPLRIIMETLAQAGLHAGINLRRHDGRLTFVHRMVLLVLEKS